MILLWWNIILYTACGYSSSSVHTLTRGLAFGGQSLARLLEQSRHFLALKSSWPNRLVGGTQRETSQTRVRLRCLPFVIDSILNVVPSLTLRALSAPIFGFVLVCVKCTL